MHRSNILSVSLLSTALLLSLGCSVYSNTDRENFNSRATVQQTAGASCTLEIEPSSKDDSHAAAIAVRCGKTPNAKTIVRVSR